MGAEQAEWRVVTTRGDAARPEHLDLSKVVGGGNRAVYLRVKIGVPAATTARLELGSDDGIKAWLNGSVVHANNASRGYRTANDQAEVSLDEGWNTLLLKITQGGGGWGAGCRVRALDGGLLDGLEFKVD